VTESAVTPIPSQSVDCIRVTRVWDIGEMMIGRRNLTYSEKGLSHCHFVKQKSHVDFLEILPVWPCDKLLELWNELQILKEMVKVGVLCSYLMTDFLKNIIWYYYLM